MNHDYLDQLKALHAQGKIPFHMPGHKRNPAFGSALPYALDVTEVKSAWNLHHPDETLKKRLQSIAKNVGANASFFMTNGSTGGNLSALYTLAPPGSGVILSRACHMSILHGLEILNLKPIYLDPPMREDGMMDRMPPEAVEEALEAHPEAHTMIITSPTYEGMVADLPRIAALCHAHDAFLMVDQAHGAHLRYVDSGLDAVRAGADIVVESLHKMLPALTPAAMVHGSARIDSHELARAISIFETSSPSHVIVASADHCLHLLEENGVAAHAEAQRIWTEMKEKWGDWSYLQILPNDDPFKVVISTRRAAIDGAGLARALDQHGIVPEMVRPESVLLLRSMADRPADVQTLFQALAAIDQTLAPAMSNTPPLPTMPPTPEMVMTFGAARRSKDRLVLLEDAVGEIAAETVWTYPPGIPLLLPGERIGVAQTQFLRMSMDRGIPVRTDQVPEGCLQDVHILVTKSVDMDGGGSCD